MKNNVKGICVCVRDLISNNRKYAEKDFVYEYVYDYCNEIYYVRLKDADSYLKNSFSTFSETYHIYFITITKKQIELTTV